MRRERYWANERKIMTIKRPLVGVGRVFVLTGLLHTDGDRTEFCFFVPILIHYSISAAFLAGVGSMLGTHRYHLPTILPRYQYSYRPNNYMNIYGNVTSISFNSNK